MPHPALQLQCSPQASETGFRCCLGLQWNIMHTSAQPLGVALPVLPSISTGTAWLILPPACAERRARSRSVALRLPPSKIYATVLPQFSDARYHGQ